MEELAEDYNLLVKKMRALEILLLVCVTVLPFVKRPLLTVVHRKYVLGFLILTLVLHLSIEGWRWQMLIAYFLILVLLWRIIRVNLSKPSKLAFFRGLGFLMTILLVIIGWVLPIVLPVFSLPEPTGPYRVGTQWIHLKTELKETITKDPTDNRELMIKVWYPSNATVTKKHEPYVDQANRLGFITKYSQGILPSWTINYLDRVKTHVYEGIAIANEKFPILIFSHGYGSKSTGYYALLTELASHGYVIVNMTHTYESLGTTFPDGTMKFFDYDFQAKISSESMKHIDPIKDAFTKDISFKERHAILREASKEYSVTEVIKRWSKDIVYTIDQFNGWNTQGFFKNKLDVTKIGVFGHSVGGGAAGQSTIKDNRIKAAANIDGVQWGEMMDTIYHKPFLYISADWPTSHPDINSHAYLHKSTDYFYETKLLKSGHPNFMDIPFMIPIKSIAGTGTIDARLGIEITTQLVTTFFDKHLKKNKTIDLRKLGEHYELLEMTIHKGDSVR